MLSLILFLSIIITVVLTIMYLKGNDASRENMTFSIVCSYFISILLIIVFFAVIAFYIPTKQIPNKISMYQEENNKIEKDIDELVSNYMKYEEDTFSELKVENSITLVSMYPELKSDELVKEQIKTYVKNNEHIKKLKSNEIDSRAYQWWLYFGN